MANTPLISLAALALLAAPLARAQSDGARAPISPLDQGVADRSPLATSFIVPPVDARLPLNFSQVYEVPGKPGLLMRRHGAVAALFARSEYVETEDGLVPVIPAGTVYHIGALPLEGVAAWAGVLEPPPTLTTLIPEDQRPPHSLNRVNGRLSAFASEGPQSALASTALPNADVAGAPRDPAAHDGGPAPAPSAEPATIWSDEGYRRRRIGALIAQAARAHAPSGAPSLAHD